MMPHGISKGLCYKLSFCGILVTASTFVRFPINTNNFELNLKKINKIKIPKVSCFTTLIRRYGTPSKRSGSNATDQNEEYVT